MTHSMIALIGYITWTLLLIVWIGLTRSLLTLRGQKKANTFQPDGLDVSPFSGRLCRAHANCYECFPIFGGLLLLAISTGITELTDPLALVFLGARLAQSIIHLISTSVIAVQARFAFFVVQMATACWWVFTIVRHFLTQV